MKEEQTLTPEAIAAGVVRDVILAKLGTPKHKDVIGKPVRLVIVRRKTDGCMGRTLARHGSPRHVGRYLVALASIAIDGPLNFLSLVQMRARLPGTLKCRTGALTAMAIQIYAALIASLMLVLWTKPQTE